MPFGTYANHVVTLMDDNGNVQIKVDGVPVASLLANGTLYLPPSITNPAALGIQVDAGGKLALA